MKVVLTRGYGIHEHISKKTLATAQREGVAKAAKIHRVHESTIYRWRKKCEKSKTS